MGNKSQIFNRIPNTVLFLVLIVLLFLKIIFYILIKNQIISVSLGGGSDANYYNNYAKGYIDIALNIWPVMLRYLNDIGLYSREVISYLMFIINLVFIPFTMCHLAGLNYKTNQKYYFYLFLLCIVYPTLFFFTFDIYRDVFMVFSFLIGCLVVKKYLSSKSPLSSIFYFVLAIVVGAFLLALRPYLGYAFLISLFLWRINFTKKRIIILGFLYLIVLFVANYAGLFESLTEYRSGFEDTEGGSNLGLNFSNPVMFIPNFILSFFGQMLGLFVTNISAVFLLIVETLPFFFMLIYVLKNIRLANSFLRFLIIFFVLYASVWLIGNDNLGTAVRLRLYNYLAIYICFFYILKIQVQLKSKNKFLEQAAKQ